jgi:hypothetical protein
MVQKSSRPQSEQPSSAVLNGAYSRLVDQSNMSTTTSATNHSSLKTSKNSDIELRSKDHSKSLKSLNGDLGIKGIKMIDTNEDDESSLNLPARTASDADP